MNVVTEHKDAFLYFACFLFTSVFSDLPLIFATHGFFLGVVLLVLKSFSLVFFPVKIGSSVILRFYNYAKTKKVSKNGLA